MIYRTLGQIQKEKKAAAEAAAAKKKQEEDIRVAKAERRGEERAYKNVEQARLAQDARIAERKRAEDEEVCTAEAKRTSVAVERMNADAKQAAKENERRVAERKGGEAEDAQLLDNIEREHTAREQLVTQLRAILQWLADNTNATDKDVIARLGQVGIKTAESAQQSGERRKKLSSLEEEIEQTKVSMAKLLGKADKLQEKEARVTELEHELEKKKIKITVLDQALPEKEAKVTTLERDVEQ